jgi:hypothetical protein
VPVQEPGAHMVVAIGKYVRLNLYGFARHFFYIEPTRVNLGRYMFNNNSLQALSGHVLCGKRIGFNN